jgi:hypothetical protein
MGSLRLLHWRVKALTGKAAERERKRFFDWLREALRRDEERPRVKVSLPFVRFLTLPLEPDQPLYVLANKDAMLIANLREMIRYHQRKEFGSRAFGDSKEANRHRDAIATLSNSLVRINERSNDLNK